MAIIYRIGYNYLKEKNGRNGRMFYFSRKWKPCEGISCEKSAPFYDGRLGLYVSSKYPLGLKSNDTIFNLKVLKNLLFNLAIAENCPANKS